VVGTNIVRSQHTPLRIIPAFVQAAEDNIKSSPNKERGILHEDVFRSYLPNDTEHLEPEGRLFTGNPGSVSGGADILAREPSRHHINNASPRSSVKRSDVIPNRERGQVRQSVSDSVVLSLYKYRSTVGVEFDCTHAAVSAEQSAKYASTNACEKM